MRESHHQGRCRRGGGFFGEGEELDSPGRSAGLNFLPPCYRGEWCGGAVNERFRAFLVALASSSSPSPPERALFLGYALQRIGSVSLKGVCAIILGRLASPGAPSGLQTREPMAERRELTRTTQQANHAPSPSEWGMHVGAAYTQTGAPQATPTAFSATRKIVYF